MSSHRESAVSFICGGETLVGILGEPTEAASADLGVLIIVGGPQYRAGSHRQFTLMARHLAARGFASFRFDYRGMGDSPGDAKDFLGVDADISAAISAFQSAKPAVRRIVLWGLCDAASAALLYIGSHDDMRVQALCLVNPWARSTASLAKTTVKHYYRRRIVQKEFWLKLASGRLGLGAIQTLVRNVQSSISGDGRQTDITKNGTFQHRMLAALRSTGSPCLLLLSSLDQTAQEFVEHARTADAWNHLTKQANIKVISIEGADHTLSKLQHQKQMFGAIAEWLENLYPLFGQQTQTRG